MESPRVLPTKLESHLKIDDKTEQMITTMQTNSDDTYASEAGAVTQDNTHKQPTQFLDLPTELRWKVYSYFLPTEDVPEECYPNWSSGKLPHFVVPVDPPVLLRLWADARLYCQQEMRFTPCALASNPDRKLMAPCRAFRPDLDTLCLLSIDDESIEAWTNAMKEHFKGSGKGPKRRLGFPFKASKAETVLSSEAYQDQFFRPRAIRNVRIGARLLDWSFSWNTIPASIQDYPFVVKIARNFRGAKTRSSRWPKCLVIALYDSDGLVTDTGEATETPMETSPAEIANGRFDVLLLFDTIKNNWVVQMMDRESIRVARLNENLRWSRSAPASMEKWRTRRGRFGLGDGSEEEVVESLRTWAQLYYGTKKKPDELADCDM